MKKISLIITVYNRAHLLRKALLSISYQSVKPDEIILTDDGSDENIIGKVNDIILDLNIPAKFVQQENKGFRLAKCRNNGARNSTGDILIFLDQDLVMSKNYIKSFCENMKAKQFLTSYPIRLSEEQSDKLSEEQIAKQEYNSILTSDQKSKIKKQFRKDYFSFFFHKARLVKQKPKMRGGACAINREDYISVNGYDELYEGWGNEDDDIRRRFFRASIAGYNPHYTEFPMHLYHEPFHNDGVKTNHQYNRKRIAEISWGQFYCEYGFNNPVGDDQISTRTLL